MGTLNDVKIDICKHTVRAELKSARDRGVNIPPPDEDFMETLDKIFALIKAGENVDPKVWSVCLKSAAYVMDL